MIQFLYVIEPNSEKNEERNILFEELFCLNILLILLSELICSFRELILYKIISNALLPDVLKYFKIYVNSNRYRICLQYAIILDWCVRGFKSYNS